MTNIAYYISGHGFGHAARQQPIVQRLAEMGLHVYVRTGAPQKFFTSSNVTYHEQQYDIGMVQVDAMSIDPLSAFRWYGDFLARQGDVIKQEVAFIRENDIRLVVCDIPPVACEIASVAGIPSVVVSHFTWDWVYQYYMDDLPQYQYIIDSITASYSKATLLLEMPFAHPMPQFSKIEKIPMVINPLTKSREAVRAEFDVPDGDKLCVISMGGMDWAGNMNIIKQKAGWTFIVTPAAWEQAKDWPNTRLVNHGYQGFHNVLAAADLSVGKTGYSTISEVIGHNTPMIYIRREGWRENDLMAAAMQRYSHSIEINHAQYDSGEWVAWIDELAARDSALPTIETNGVEVAANRLRDYAEGRESLQYVPITRLNLSDSALERVQKMGGETVADCLAYFVHSESEVIHEHADSGFRQVMYGEVRDKLRELGYWQTIENILNASDS